MLVSYPSRAVFLSYASQDAEAAQRICEALRAAGIKVWFDQSELRGGDAWDQSIRKQIKTCALFVPIISKHTHERAEGYFRLEWKLAVDRSHLITSHKAFLLPVVIDETNEEEEHVPDKFREVQWTRLPGGVTPAAFVERVQRLLSGEPAQEPTRTASAAGRVPVTPTTRKPVLTSWRLKAALLAASAVVVVALGYLVATRLVLSKRGAEVAPATAFAPPPRSIAVLPFADLSEKHDQEYFGDGMAEEIRNLLVRVPGIKATGRTSSFKYRGLTEDPGKIGAALRTAYLVEGSVRRSADRVRVTAELISTRDGLQRWSNTYDRDVHDVLKVQGEIAASVVRALQMEIKSASYLPKEETLRSTEAYEAYLRGYHAHDEYSPAGLDEAVADFRRAHELDPTFVPAAELLAMTIRNQASFGFIERRAGFEDARRACREVLNLDPGSGLAHAILGDIAIEYDWDWDGADREFKKALALSPNDANVLIFASLAPQVRGDLPEALRLIELSLNADPLDSANTVSLGWVYLAMGRHADAVRAFRHALEIAPRQFGVHAVIGLTLLVDDRPREALAEVLQEQVESRRLTMLATCYHALHRDKESDASLEQLTARYAGVAAFPIANVYAWRGQTDAAFQWLDRAYQQRDAALALYVKYDPMLSNLSHDPRYKALLRKMKLPE